MSEKFSRSQIEVRVNTLVAEVTGYDEALLTPDTRLVADGGGDKVLSVGSLELAELLISIDEEFHVNIPDQEAGKLSTLENLVDYIVEHIK